MTTQTVPQPSPSGSVDYYVSFLRGQLNKIRQERRDDMILPAVMGTISSIVAFGLDDATEKVERIRNVLAAEKIVAAEDDGREYRRELDPEQTGAPIPAHVEGHGELKRGTEAWS